MRAIWWFAFVVLLLAPGGVAWADSLEQAAKRREESFRSVAFELEVTEVIPKGQGEVQRTAGAEKVAVPAADTQTKSRNKLTLDGNRARYDNNQPLWSLSNGRFIETSSVLVWDGTVSQSCFPGGISGRSGPQGFITGIAPPGFRSSVLTPIMIHCRGLSRSFSPYIVTGFKRTEGLLSLTGRSCREYTRSVAPGDTIDLFVDEGDQFLVRRIRKLKNGRLTYQTDITYKSTPVGEAVASWKTTEFDTAGKVKLKRDVVVSEFVASPPVNSDTFQIDFPDGCDVFDERAQKYYKTQPGGAMKEVDPIGKELGPEVPPLHASWFRRNQMTILWIMGTAIVCIGLVGLQRRLRAARSR